MKILLLGASGFIGRQAARELAARPEVTELVLADYNIREAKKLAKSLKPGIRWAMLDASKAPELERLLGDVDAVASAVGPHAEPEGVILAACAKMRVPVASLGDAPLPEPLRKELHDAFRTASVPAVSGCGLMPGWSELLVTHHLSGGESGARTGQPVPFLLFSPDRFGGYAFCRRIVLSRAEKADPPPGAPAGDWWSTRDGTRFGLPPGKPAGGFRILARTFGRLGAVGAEFFAALLFWRKHRMLAAAGVPAAAAGAFLPADDGGRTAIVTDPEGRLPALTLAECAVRLVAARGRNEKGLLPLATLLGKKEAEELAKSVGAEITVTRVGVR